MLLLLVIELFEFGRLRESEANISMLCIYASSILIKPPVIVSAGEFFTHYSVNGKVFPSQKVEMGFCDVLQQSEENWVSNDHSHRGLSSSIWNIRYFENKITDLNSV